MDADYVLPARRRQGALCRARARYRIEQELTEETEGFLLKSFQPEKLVEAGETRESPGSSRQRTRSDNMFHAMTLSFAFFFAYGAIASPSDIAVPDGKKFVSPDGRYSVQIVEPNGGSRCFAVTDEKTGAVDRTIPMPTVLLSLQWSADSKSMVAVEHIAGGSFITILHLQNGDWMASDFEPPWTGIMDSSVVNLKIHPGEVQVQYAVVDESKSGYPLGYRLCNCKVSLKTMKMKCQWRTISEDRFEEVIAHGY